KCEKSKRRMPAAVSLRSLTLRRQRQFDHEPRPRGAAAGADRPGANNVLGIDPAPVRLNDLAGNREAKPGIATESRACGALGVEAAKDGLEIFRWNTRALVFD